MLIGYTTGTFDMTHDGHFSILKRMKARCSRLIVGLTTDELGAQQKRKPILPYSSRKSILENCRYVDKVVRHIGLTKQEDLNNVRFDILFIGDDYRDAYEYTSFANKNKDVSVVYLPRTNGISTTLLLDDLPEPVVLTIGLHGPLLKFGTVIFKYIPIGRLEQGCTGDVYELPIPRPRNWKKLEAVTSFANIAGVNTNREIQIHSLEAVFGKPWNPVISVKKAWTNTLPVDSEGLFDQRKNPVEIHALKQRYAGITLRDWWYYATKEQQQQVLARIVSIIAELVQAGVIHGDIHPGNVCVDSVGSVSLIDFGWCMHSSFDMSQLEQDEYNYMLAENFDLLHFQDSLIFEGMSI